MEPQQKSYRTWFSLAGISLLLFLMAKIFHFQPGEKTAAFLLPPRRASFDLIQDKTQPAPNWETERAALNLQIQKLREENQAARRLLGAGVPPQVKFVPVHLLGMGDGEFMLDIGREQGAGEQGLILSENVIVGKITRVTAKLSQGIMVSNRNFKCAVGIWRPGEEKKSLVGKGLLTGGTRITVTEILPEEDVKEGDLVAEMEFAGQYLIGLVTKVGLEPNKVFQRAEVQWSVSPRLLNTVFVIKNP